MTWRPLAPLGLVRRHGTQHPCGLCGITAPMTKTHVPPQCAGNRGLVGRWHVVSDGQQARRGRRLHGGLYVYGLCASCNNLASRYDAAYGELAAAVRGCWVISDVTIPSNRIALPAANVKPGAVARSILIGMFGIAPNLREIIPDTAHDLQQAASSVAPPGTADLRLALARGLRARLTGPVGGMFLFGTKINGRPPGVMTLAQVYFPPLAWQLADSEPSLLDVEGWAIVTSWLGYSPEDVVQLNELVPSLPLVVHPLHDAAARAEAWTEMFSDQIAPILEADRVPE